MSEPRHSGACLCGAVRFEVRGALKAPDGCHCVACRKQTGHYLVSTNVPRAALTLHGGERVRWFRSSDEVRRGFCSACGSTLFWDPVEHDVIAIAMGAFDGPTGTETEMHIFVAEKGDYYVLADGAPQHGRWPPRSTA